MKNIKRKKAFTMVEFLFVMIIVGIIITISIKNSTDSKQSAVYTSLRSDAHNIFNYLNAYLAEKGENVDYDAISGKYQDTNNDGIADTGGVNNDGKLGSNLLRFSYGNTFELSFKKCDNGMIAPIIKVYNDVDLNKNPKYSKVAYYNGCIMNKIKLLNNSDIPSD